MKKRISRELAHVIVNGLTAKGKPHDVGWTAELGLNWSIVRKSHSYKLYRNKTPVGKVVDLTIEEYCAGLTTRPWLFVELSDKTLVQIPLKRE